MREDDDAAREECCPLSTCTGGGAGPGEGDGDGFRCVDLPLPFKSERSASSRDSVD